jgi:hypothetical protein
VTPDIETRLYRATFQIEVSARYHEWMRARYETLTAGVKGLSIGAAALAFAGVFAAGNWASGIAIASAAIAVANTADLVFGFDALARRHTDLFRRFKDLQATMLRTQDASDEQVANWEADAQIIRKDEPSTFWAIYIKSWNQSVEKRGLSREKWDRKITRTQAIFGWIRHYLPSDFPPRSGLQAG